LNQSTQGIPKVHGALESTDPESPFDGVRRVTSQTERSTVTAYCFEGGARFPIHAHAEEQITVVLEGSVEFDVEGERHRLGPGETYVVRSELVHGLQAGPDGARFLAVIVPKRTSANAYRVLDDSDA
jgi:quercetin dioxygenase-like cupin family protein